MTRRAIRSIAAGALFSVLAFATTKQIAYINKNAAKLNGKALSIDGCVTRVDADRGEFELEDDSRIIVISKGELPSRDECMWLRGVVALRSGSEAVIREQQRRLRRWL